MFNIDPQLMKINRLINAIADELSGFDSQGGTEISLDLQPTSQAAQFAAQAAVSCLLAHELGTSNLTEADADDSNGDRVDCPKCGKSYKRTGLQKHLSKCKSISQAAAQDAIS